MARNTQTEDAPETVDVGPITVGQPEQVELIEPGTDRRVSVSAHRVAVLVNVHGYKRA